MITETLAVLNSPRWMEYASCRRADPEVFYSCSPSGKFRPEEIAKAVQVCDACPVEIPCLEWALKRQDAHAILGGKTPEERMRILKGAA